MSCWKCGKELPDDHFECTGGCGEITFQPSPCHEVDWTKVKSFEDFREIFATIKVYIDPAQYPSLKKWLKSGPKQP